MRVIPNFIMRLAFFARCSRQFIFVRDKAKHNLYSFNLFVSTRKISARYTLKADKLNKSSEKLIVVDFRVFSKVKTIRWNELQWNF